MLIIQSHRLLPYLPFGQPPPFTDRTAAKWLHDIINLLYNRHKGALKSAGLQTYLFHNHDEETDKIKNLYPLINYHYFENSFYVTGINEGALTLQGLIEIQQPPVCINKDLYLVFETLPVEETEIKTGDAFYKYSITDWLPFDSKAYKTYAEIKTLADKLQFLENRLMVHIKNDFGKYLELNLSDTQVNILEVDSFKRSCMQLTQNRHQHDFQPFSLIFETNVNLPDLITLGNGKAVGFGRVMKHDGHFGFAQ